MLNTTVKNLRLACDTAKRALSSRSTLLILHCLHLKAVTREKGDGASEPALRVVGSDLEMWHTAYCGVEWGADQFAKAHPDGVCLNAAVLANLLSKLPADKVISITQHEGENMLHLLCGGVSSKLPYLPGEEFPSVPELGGDCDVLTFKGDHFARLIGHTLYAAATDPSRPLLTGVLIETAGEECKVVATDTHRLPVATTTDFTRSGHSRNAVTRTLPPRTAKEFGSFAAKAETIVLTFPRAGGNIAAVIGDVSLYSRCIDGEYPNWARIVPSDHQTTGTFIKSELLNTISIVQIAAQDNANRCVIDMGEGGETVVSADSVSAGSIVDKLEYMRDGKEIRFAANVGYIKDAAANMDVADGIRFELSEPLRPMVLRPAKTAAEYGFDYFTLVMPMQEM